MMAASLAIILYGLQQPRVQEGQLVNQFWVDRIPQDPSESFRGYLFDMEGFGIMAEAPTCYRITFELFEYREDGKAISYAFPHDGRRANTPFTIEPLRPPTRDFDTRLTILKDPNNKNKKTVYYTGPDLRSTATFPPTLRQAFQRTHLQLSL